VCRTIGQPALADDERFDTNAKRVARHAEIKPVIEAWEPTSRWTTSWAMLAAGVPASPINTIDRLVNDPHRRRSRDVRRRRASCGRQDEADRQPHQAWCDAGTHATPAPLLGQHNEAVFGRLLGIEGERL
jgi:formyl-CoA transferase